VKLGDLVSHENRFWIVTRYDPKRTKTATLREADGTALEVPCNAPVTVIANPGQEWPFVAAPLKPKWGPITTLARPTSPGTVATGGLIIVPLTLYQDWLPSEPSRAGGSIFLNPALHLQAADTLLATHSNGRSSSLVIPGHFGTVYQRRARAAASPKPVDRTAYDRLLDDDQFEDD
jgi:hypothetical protein